MLIVDMKDYSSVQDGDGWWEVGEFMKFLQPFITVEIAYLYTGRLARLGHN